jgi:hypothetical protein
MALYGTQRDVSLIRHLNRELLWDIITQECVYYQFKTAETKTNMYGEAAGAKYYGAPVILNMLVDRGDNTSPTGDMGVDYARPMTFKFFRDDLVDASLVPDVGDIIMWYEGYWEVENTNANQFFVGKDPAYPYNVNPLNPGLENYGTNLSIMCICHYIPADQVQITKERI